MALHVSVLREVGLPYGGRQRGPLGPFSLVMAPLIKASGLVLGNAQLPDKTRGPGREPGPNEGPEAGPALEVVSPPTLPITLVEDGLVMAPPGFSTPGAGPLRPRAGLAIARLDKLHNGMRRRVALPVSTESTDNLTFGGRAAASWVALFPSLLLERLGIVSQGFPRTPALFDVLGSHKEPRRPGTRRASPDSQPALGAAPFPKLLRHVSHHRLTKRPDF